MAMSEKSSNFIHASSSSFHVDDDDEFTRLPTATLNSHWRLARVTEKRGCIKLGSDGIVRDID
jgi:hypothetical protein